MIQFEYNTTMKRYDVKVPSMLAGVKSMTTVAHIDEEEKSNITIYKELPMSLVRQILMNWEEYLFQMSRDLQGLLDDEPKQEGDE